MHTAGDIAGTSLLMYTDAEQQRATWQTTTLQTVANFIHSETTRNTVERTCAVSCVLIQSRSFGQIHLSSLLYLTPAYQPPMLLYTSAEGNLLLLLGAHW